MISKLKFLAPLALLAVTACAAPFQAQVSRFQRLPAPQGQSFYVVADNPHLDNSLEFSRYASLIADHLAREGYVRATSEGEASLLVRVDYGVDHGRERIRSTPALGGGFGYGFGWGGYHPYYGYGRRAFIYGFDDPFLYGANDVQSYTVFQSELDMKIESKATHERLFEGTAKAMSSDDDLTVLVPNLVDAMFTGFPGNSGQTVKITVAPPEKTERR